MPRSNFDPPTSIPEFVRIVEGGMKEAEKLAADMKKAIAWCEKERTRMIGLADELRAELESDDDDATKLAKASKYLDQFQAVMLTVTSRLRGQVEIAAGLRETCDMVILSCCQNIAGIAEANLAVASGLAADVVGPVQATATLANTLAKDFFEPALKAAEKAEDAIPEVVTEAEKVRRPIGSDVQAVHDDLLRFRGELETLAAAFSDSPFLVHLAAVQEYMNNAKPIVELFDV